MSDSVQMPALGESVTEGTVTRWLKQVGDQVEVDEPLLEVSTDKVDTEIPSPFAGTLTEILVEEDETVDVGTPLATIGSADEAPSEGSSGQDSSDAPDTQDDQQEEPSSAEGAEASDGAAGAAEQQAAQVPPEVTDEAEQEAQPAAEQAADTGGASEDVTMPALGESVTEGTVTRWLKEVGDTVEVDEPLLEVSTDKVDTEIPSPFAGTLTEILVQEDETVDVGTALARVGSGSSAGSGGSTQETSAPPAQEQAPAPAETAEAEPEQVAPSSETQASAVTAAVPEAPAQQENPVSEPSGGDRSEPVEPAPSGGASGYLTPLVRKLAAEKGVDLSSLSGTGVGGRIRKEDVLEAAERAQKEREERAKADKEKSDRAAAQQAAPAQSASKPAAAAVSPLRGKTEKASRLRQIIAERMVEALHSQAQLTTVVEVDVTKVARLRTRAKNDFKAREGVNLTFLPFFVLAATEALKAHPKVNGVLEGNQITYHDQENVGIAVDTERGLLVPVIRDAGDLNLAGVARKIADLATRTRDNKVTPDELSGATFTVTNTGSGGALFDTPIVPGGTSAILGTGAIVKRPVVATDEDGGEYIAIRSMCYLSLSYDHRLVDGADASRYLATVKKRIEDGDFESEVGA
ncbi:2-oxoglutarate dehydrogenase, E2 component, dihydrolipoamide succinyltransferase [Actinotalea sp. K2]|uniref:2-oxoglutarate dehydrogenase, E2 component, dihydrolipoamide succinyltransferase n=1 Tax=Actinotalea sp. K2 TaxID=2939438 RepID=UPI002017B112|nr:2-oxoglutarate dehydrogenase, E2 component, dihydrolipoamide succinyltransferase [Actinotalea sp. K2]MCL3860715.1 2-oxoglutarate dehydrogenase, E2 component, dihydrolipoamide succinyltransferase [Actinotalea sp. K2]